jgi:hypothetical protein
MFTTAVEEQSLNPLVREIFDRSKRLTESQTLDSPSTEFQALRDRFPSLR